MPTYNFLGIHFEQVLTAVTHKKNFSFGKFQGKEKLGNFLLYAKNQKIFTENLSNLE